MSSEAASVPADTGPFCAGLMIIGLWRRSAFVRWQALVLIAATIVKVFIYDVSELDRAYSILSFIVLGALLLAISLLSTSATGCNFRRRRIRLGHRGDSIAFLLLAVLAVASAAAALACDHGAGIEASDLVLRRNPDIYSPCRT